MNDILILTSGKVSKLDSFKGKGVTLGSFDDINFNSETNDLRIMNIDLRIYKIIYFRMVGKSLEVATLVANYAIKNNIKVVDKVYTDSILMPTSLGKSLELKRLVEANIPIPKTVFGKLELPFPFVVKSTTSSRAREVWKVENKAELDELKIRLKNLPAGRQGKFFFAQEFIPNAHRARVLVVGDKVIGGILRHTKWNKDETKVTLNHVPKEMEELAIKATNAVGLDICGVDLLIDKNNKLYVIEANAAPSWKLINKYCGVVVEDEIIKYLSEQI